MSDSLAIAAITNSLRDLLQSRLTDADNALVVTRPPDKVQANANRNQVNLFLYHAEVDAHWRNMDVPWKVKPGETGQTPLPLRLYYLITAYYGESEDGVDTTTNENRLLGSHRLLGRAMSILHDYPLLDASTINNSLPSADSVDHPYDQVEPIRITPHLLSLDEVAKIWTGFQTQYRLSAAYCVAVVLLEGDRNARTPLPVLTRGRDDSGPIAQADMLPRYPTLTGIRFANQQPCARPGETLTLVGHHLQAQRVTVRCENRRLELTHEIVTPPGSDKEIAVSLPDEPAHWPIGHYVIGATLEQGNETRQTNTLSFAFVPSIKLEKTGEVAVANGRFRVTLHVECRPQIRPGQWVALLWGDREILPVGANAAHDDAPNPALPTALAFQIEDVAAGLYRVRLRVDGLDSLYIDWTKTPTQFDDTYLIEVGP